MGCTSNLAQPVQCESKMKDTEDPPPILGSAKVLAFAIVDSTIKFVQNKLLYVDGKLLGPVPKLAICKFPTESEVCLYFCDDDWSMLGFSVHESLEAAKRRAEKSYPGLLNRWRPYHHKDEAAIDRRCLEPFCTFCGKSFIETERMVQGKEAWICEGCVRALSDSLDNER